MNVAKLKSKLVEREINVATLAEMIGMDSTVLYRRLKVADMKIGEAIKIKDALGLTNEEATEIFLT